MMYERQFIATGGLPFAELRQLSLIDRRAQAADQDPEFSARIRDGLPERETPCHSFLNPE